jgi:hypothetical protein
VLHRLLYGASAVDAHPVVADTHYRDPLVGPGGH